MSGRFSKVGDDGFGAEVLSILRPELEAAILAVQKRTGISFQGAVHQVLVAAIATLASIDRTAGFDLVQATAEAMYDVPGAQARQIEAFERLAAIYVTATVPARGTA